MFPEACFRSNHESKRKSQGILENILNSVGMKTAYQVLWDAAKAVLRGTWITLSAHIRQEERSQTNHLFFHLKTCKKWEKKKKWINPKASKRKALVKIRAELIKLKIDKLEKDQWNQFMVLYQRQRKGRVCLVSVWSWGWGRAPWLSDEEISDSLFFLIK